MLANCMHRRLASAAYQGKRLCEAWCAPEQAGQHRSAELAGVAGSNYSEHMLRRGSLLQCSRGWCATLRAGAEWDQQRCQSRTCCHALVKDGDEDVQRLPDQRLAHLRLARPQQVHEHLRKCSRQLICRAVSDSPPDVCYQVLAATVVHERHCQVLVLHTPHCIAVAKARWALWL